MIKELLIHIKYKLQTKCLSPKEVEDFMKDDDSRKIKLTVPQNLSSLIDYKFRGDVDDIKKESGIYQVIQFNEQDSSDNDTVLVTKGNTQMVYSFNSENDNLKKKIILNMVRQIINTPRIGGLYG